MELSVRAFPGVSGNTSAFVRQFFGEAIAPTVVCTAKASLALPGAAAACPNLDHGQLMWVDDLL